MWRTTHFELKLTKQFAMQYMYDVLPNVSNIIVAKMQ